MKNVLKGFQENGRVGLRPEEPGRLRRGAFLSNSRVKSLESWKSLGSSAERPGVMNSSATAACACRW